MGISAICHVLRTIMEIREAVSRDAEGIYIVQRDAWLDVYPNDSFGILRKDIAKKFADKNTAIEKIADRMEGYGTLEREWVAESDGRIVGHVTVSGDSQGYILDELHVLPEYQRKTIGGKILQKVLESFGNMEIRLDVVIYNERAIRFYKKHGFRIVSGTEGRLEVFGNKILPTIGMVRDGQGILVDNGIATFIGDGEETVL